MRRDYAVRVQGLEKTYRLYASRRQAALDQLGYYRMRFWARRPQWREFTALRGVNLEIRRGERVGIVGRNGAGKTTLLQLITGNFAPTRGSVQVRGDVQALMQTGLGFHPEFSGLDNLRSALVYNGLEGTRLESAVEDVVGFAELGAFIHQPLKTYSLGMAARLEFAAATAIDPDILIVDEVLGAGDGYFVYKSAARMRKLTNKGCTLLLVSHSSSQILAFCERAIWLDQGSVRADGAVREILDQYANSFVGPDAVKPREHSFADFSVLERPFLRKAILPNEPVDPSQEREVVQHLKDGRKVFRWPGKPGPKISAIKVITQNDGLPETGNVVTLEIECEVGVGGVYEVVYRTVVYDLTGIPVCAMNSPPDRFTAERGARRIARMTLDPVLLGGRDYVCSIAIIDSDPRTRGDAGPWRYDLLSRSLGLGMRQTNDADPPYLHYPAAWQFGTDSSTHPSRISGWQ